MKIIRTVAMLTLAAFLLVSCAGGTTAYTYDDPDHTHVFGNRYDIVPATCVGTGTEMRYCKICHDTVLNTVEVPADMAARKHAFSDTVIAATEATEGYTLRQCTLCPYIVERAFVTPAKYALLASDATVTTSPAGVVAVAVSDTGTHQLYFDVARDTAVNPVIAARLAVALAVMDELTRAGTPLSEGSEIALVSGTGVGNTFTVRRLLFAWIEEGDADVARAFAFALDGSEAGFSARVAARLAKLGVSGTVTVDPIAPENGTATLGATATLVARALDEPLLQEAFAEAVGLSLVAGRDPALYLVSPDGTLRVTALSVEGGGYRFAAVYGSTLPNDIENTLYAGV